MPKLVSSLVHAQIMLLNPLLKHMDLKIMRKLQDALGVLGATTLAGEIDYLDEPFEAFDAAWAVPKDTASDKAILYLHGGAYTAGCLSYAKGFGGVLAEQTQLKVLCVGYRLAPEYPYPAALNDALDAYQRMLETYAPEDILLVGESAGGGLCYCLCLKLKALGLPQPSRIIALSPWTDLTMDQERYSGEVESTDPVVSVDGLRYSALMYAGERVNEPTASPLYGDLSGLPDSLIFAGSEETLLGDSVEMARRLEEQGSTCELHVEEGMWHAYVLYGIPEAKAALKRIREYAADVDSGETVNGEVQRREYTHLA
jgi:epsilon-lactone hydrolase